MIKKIIFIIIIILGIAGSIWNNNLSKKVYIKKDSKGYHLIVNRKPYIIKGMVYSPIPIGRNYEYNFWCDKAKPYLTDGKMMKDMGCNTIRVYQTCPDIIATKKVMRELYARYGIRVAIGHWLGFWDNPNYADQKFRSKVIKDVLEMVQTYKNEKGVLMWILGNENNVSFSYGPQTMNLWTTPEIENLGDPYLKRQARAKYYYGFVNEVAREIHKIDPNHPIVLANAELTDIDIASDITPDIDILGCSIYRGKSFGSFFRQAENSFKRPVVVTEFGCDSFDAYLNKEDEESQAEFIEAEWMEIAKNTYKGNGVGNSLGGFVFEWTDEWWKTNPDDKMNWYTHDISAGWSNGAYYFDIKAPGNLNINEEWWGVCSVTRTDNALDERKPRKAYFVLKELWKR